MLFKQFFGENITNQIHNIAKTQLSNGTFVTQREGNWVENLAKNCKSCVFNFMNEPGDDFFLNFSC